MSINLHKFTNTTDNKIFNDSLKIYLDSFSSKNFTAFSQSPAIFFRSFGAIRLSRTWFIARKLSCVVPPGDATAAFWWCVSTILIMSLTSLNTSLSTFFLYLIYQTNNFCIPVAARRPENISQYYSYIILNWCNIKFQNIQYIFSLMLSHNMHIKLCGIACTIELGNKYY